jgi:S1-C subfamily serine protease
MSEILKAVSQALVETVNAVEGSVVRVEARQRLPASGVVWSDEGLVVTAAHVIERDRDVRLGLADGRVLPARLLGRDPGTDLALLRAEGGASAGLKAPAWASADALQVGSLVLALGRPGGKVLATFGIVSAVDPGWNTPPGGFVDHFVQSDTVMYPGFSGGALVDADQRILGVNTSALVSGLSVTIPTATVRRVVDALRHNQRVRRGYLGVQAQAVPLPEALRDRLQQESGLLLIHVEPNSPAAQSRLVQGDTLVTLNGQPLRTLGDLALVLNGDRGDDQVLAQVVRAGQVRELPIAIGERTA